MSKLKTDELLELDRAGFPRRANYSYPNDGLDVQAVISSLPEAERASELRTQQSFAAECDINNILARAQRDGFIEHVARNKAQYLDLADMPTYQEAMNVVAQANQAFDLLPAKVRLRFQNDPAQFLEFVDDPKNFEEARLLGLLAEPEPGAPERPQGAGVGAPGDQAASSQPGRTASSGEPPLPLEGGKKGGKAD